MSKENYSPPYRITPAIITLIEQIGEALGALSSGVDDLRLRRIHRIQTIHGSLAIEGNTLSEEQISTILDGKPVIAPPREVQEVRNAIKAYDAFMHWQPERQDDLLIAHETLMLGLLDAPGHYRTVESMVYAHQQAYYSAIADSTKSGESTPFVEFMLQTIHERILRSSEGTDQVGDQVTDQVNLLLAVMKWGEAYTRAALLLSLKHRVNFYERHLRPALDRGLIEMTVPDKPTSRLQKYRLTEKGRRVLGKMRSSNE